MEYEKQHPVKVAFKKDQFTVARIQKSQDMNGQLLSEAFKVDTLLNMMNSCADKCELPYYKTGLKDTELKGVECYKTCVTKGYKLAMNPQ